jgi:hypothetical protein
MKTGHTVEGWVDPAVYKPLTHEEALALKKQYSFDFVKKMLPLKTKQLADSKVINYLWRGLEDHNDVLRDHFPDFYHLPKIHKSGPLKGRPIVAAYNAITTPLSRWLDVTLQPYGVMCLSNLRDSKSLAVELESLVIPKDAWLLTADVESLYPSIPIDEGITIVLKVLTDFGMSADMLTMVEAALRLVLTNNIFTFNDLFFQQIRGTAMGTPCAPVFAILFLYGLEQRLDSSLWIMFKRYIDDILAIFKTKAEAERFIASYNALHPNIRITWELSQSHVDFLDLHLFKGSRFFADGRLDTSVHAKNLNKYLYVPYSSHHDEEGFR